MKRKWRIICIICIIVLLISLKMGQEPKLVTCITTMNKAYLTIVVNPIEFVNVEKMEEKIAWMCKNDAFETIKLRSDDKEGIKHWYIMVYSSKANLEKGKNGHIIKFEQ